MKNYFRIQEEVSAAKTSLETLDAIKEFLRLVLSQEGSWIHLEIVDKILEKEKVQDPHARDILATKLLGQCLIIEAGLSQISTEEEIYRKSLFVWDWVFLKALINLGPYGKKFAKQIVMKLEGNFFSYHETKKSKHLSECWFVEQHDEEKIRFFHSPVFLILGEAIWLDLAKHLWMRKKKMFQPSLRECGSLHSSHYCPKKRRSF